MFDLKEQFQANGQKLQTHYDFKDSCAYVCTYRVISPTGGYSWNVLDSYTPTSIISQSRTQSDLKSTPSPNSLKKS